MSSVKVIELVGQSSEGWQQAAQNAVQEAARTVAEIDAVEVYNMTANVDQGRIIDYKANVKVVYREGGL